MLKSLLRKSTEPAGDEDAVTCVLGSSFTSQRTHMKPCRTGAWEVDGNQVLYAHFSFSGLEESQIPVVFQDDQIFAVRLSLVLRKTRVIFDQILNFQHLDWTQLPDSRIAQALPSLQSTIASRCNVRLAANDALCAYVITDIFVSLPLSLFSTLPESAKTQTQTQTQTQTAKQAQTQAKEEEEAATQQATQTIQDKLVVSTSAGILSRWIKSIAAACSQIKIGSGLDSDDLVAAALSVGAQQFFVLSQ